MFKKKEKNNVRELMIAHYVKKVKSQAEREKSNAPQCPQDSFVSLQHIQKIYPNGYHAVVDFNLEISKGEFVIFVGPSGCGKTTTLRMICGLEEISAGSLFIDGVYSNLLSPSERGISMVFQNYALFPHLTAYENIAYGLKIKKVKAPVYDKEGNQVVGIDHNAIAFLEKEKKWILKHDPNNKEDIENIDHDIQEYMTHEIPLFKYRKLTAKEVEGKVNFAAEILNLKELLQRKPAQLSGGQCQRVALGRVIVNNAKLLLMDEPLSNLDAKLRDSMRSEILKLHKSIGATTVYVTHDQVEAMTMADRIVVMDRAKIIQVGTPKEVYEHPNSLFVATFIGSPNMNITPVVFSNGNLQIGDNVVYGSDDLHDRLTDFYRKQKSLLEEQRRQELDGVSNEALKSAVGKEYDEKIDKIGTLLKDDRFDLKLGVRPEDIFIDANGAVSGVVESKELLGDEYHVKIKVADRLFVFKMPTDTTVEVGEVVKVSFRRNKLHLFDAVTAKAVF